MFSNLSDSLDKTFRNLRGVGKISESNITAALKEIRMALMEADVDYAVAKEFVEAVKEKAMGVDVLKSVKPGEQIVKIFHDELADLLDHPDDVAHAEDPVGHAARVELEKLV